MNDSCAKYTNFSFYEHNGQVVQALISYSIGRWVSISVSSGKSHLQYICEIGTMMVLLNILNACEDADENRFDLLKNSITSVTVLD